MLTQELIPFHVVFYHSSLFSKLILVDVAFCYRYDMIRCGRLKCTQNDFGKAREWSILHCMDYILI